MNRAPSLQFYPADWRKDPGVQALGFFERGVWFEILCIMFESEQRGKLVLNGKRMPDEALGRLLGLDNQILTTTLTTLIEYGVMKVDEETGILFNRRMVEDERLRVIRRECGSRGGNPALLGKKSDSTLVNQIPTTPVNQIPTPSSSPSSSKKKNIGDPRVSTLIFFFVSRVEEVKNFRPEVNGADAKLVKSLLSRHNEDTIKAIINFFIQSEKAEKVGITLAAALSRHSVNTFLQAQKHAPPSNPATYFRGGHP